MIEQVATREQLGRVTNALSWCFSEPQKWMFEACSEEQIREGTSEIQRLIIARKLLKRGLDDI